MSKWPLILVYKGLYLVLPHLLGWPPHCCLDWPSRSEGAMLEDSEAKEKRDCLSGAAWDSVQGEVVVMLRAESLLCLRPLSALRPEPCRKVTCFPSVNPLGGQGHGHGCLASCFGAAWSLHRCWSPALPVHGAQPAAKMSRCRSLLVSLVTQLPHHSPSAVSALWFHFRVLPLASLLSHLGTDTQSTLSACSAGTWIFPTCAWSPPLVSSSSA